MAVPPSHSGMIDELPSTTSPSSGQVWGTLYHKWEGSTQSLSLQGFQVAYVVFQKPGGVSAALNLKGPLLVSTESHPVKNGIHSQYLLALSSVSSLGLGLVRDRFSGGQHL